MRGRRPLFHVAGTDLAARGRRRHSDVNVHGTRIVLEEALRAGVERVVHTSSVAAIGPAPRGATADETPGVPRRALRPALRQHQARGRARGAARRRRGPAGGHRQPGARLRPGDLYRSSTELVRRFLRREIPAYVDGAICIVTCWTSRAATCSPTSAAWRRALHPRQPQLHHRPPLRRPRAACPASSRRPSSSRWRRRSRWRGRRRRCRAGRLHRERGPRRVAVVGVQLGQGQAELGGRPGAPRGRPERTIAWYREREGTTVAPPGSRQPLALRVAGFGLRQAGGVLGRVAP